MTDRFQIFDGNWETELEDQFQRNDRCRKRAYICSPLTASTAEQQKLNMRYAREYMLYVSKMLNCLARAPHAYLPMLLCDAVAAERALALRFGLQLLELSDVLLVCGARLSEGMKGEISHAAKLGMPIVVFDDALHIEVRKLVTQNGGKKSLVRLDRQHPILGQSCPEMAVVSGA
jgi:hypothetical protein